ncbi:MAG: Rieske 2Fe-2S domain-containing protein [Chloroflexi bacterium]|nr:Rieske 2Fe-2S domain-containing protein [Chloroflexota bacterium]
MVWKGRPPRYEGPRWIERPPFEAKGGLGRRSFLKLALGAMGGVISVGVGVPIAGYFISPILRRKRVRSWAPLGGIDGFRFLEPKHVDFEERMKDAWITQEVTRAVWVVRKGEEDFRVYNPHCTHLGCAYGWHTSGPHKDHFVSPCHNGIYDIDGNVLGGPPPRPLDTLEWKIEKGELYAVYKDFQLGVPQKKEL